MKRTVWALLLGSTLLALSSRPAVEAASIRPVTFDDMVRQAALIVRGSVVEMRSYIRGVGVVRNTVPKDGQLPVERVLPQGEFQTPESAGTRGGRMIFTRIVVRADEAVKGAASQLVEFDVAGGTVDGRTALVPGMPKFDRDGDYVLFLREGFEKAADPIVGVRQGFFRVVDDGASGKAVLNTDFDYVIAIEKDGVVPRHNPKRGAFLGRERPVPQLAPVPVPDADGEATMSAAARRYLTSDEPPFTVDQFVAAIRTRLGR
jgi:hypothetical protein